jgi:hypothetical protein
MVQKVLFLESLASLLLVYSLVTWPRKAKVGGTAESIVGDADVLIDFCSNDLGVLIGAVLFRNGDGFRPYECTVKKC